MINAPERREGASQNILEVCEDAFDRAIKEDAAGRTGLVIVRGDAVVIRLRTLETGLDIEIKQPHPQAVISKGIAFWVERKNTDRHKPENPPPLVVAAGDASHLYMTDFEGDPLPNSQISDEETAKIALLIANGQPDPVDIIESDY